MGICVKHKMRSLFILSDKICRYGESLGGSFSQGAIFRILCEITSLNFCESNDRIKLCAVVVEHRLESLLALFIDKSV